MIDLCPTALSADAYRTFKGHIIHHFVIAESKIRYYKGPIINSEIKLFVGIINCLRENVDRILLPARKDFYGEQVINNWKVIYIVLQRVIKADRPRFSRVCHRQGGTLSPSLMRAFALNSRHDTATSTKEPHCLPWTSASYEYSLKNAVSTSHAWEVCRMPQTCHQITRSRLDFIQELMLTLTWHKFINYYPLYWKQLIPFGYIYFWKNNIEFNS